MKMAKSMITVAPSIMMMANFSGSGGGCQTTTTTIKQQQQRRRRRRRFLSSFVMLILNTMTRVHLPPTVAAHRPLWHHPPPSKKKKNRHRKEDGNNPIHNFVKQVFDRLVMNLRQHQGQRDKRHRQNSTPRKTTTKATKISNLATCPCFTVESIQTTILSANGTDHCSWVGEHDGSYYSWTSRSGKTSHSTPELVVFVSNRACRIGGTAVPVSQSAQHLSPLAYQDCVRHFNTEFQHACHGWQDYRAVLVMDPEEHVEFVI